MKLTFLGTAAAEGVPAVFCNCPTCIRAKNRGGKDVRTRSQILVDDDTLFDFPMDTYLHMLAYKLDLSAVKRVLITHAHMDHCYPQEFCMRGEPFARYLKEERITVYCNATVAEMFLSDTAREIKPEVAQNIGLEILRPFDETVSGDMRIVALPASHTKGEQCLIYYIERNGKGALLMNDTGILDISVFERLKAMNAKIDVAALDCTYGAKKHGAGRHMGLFDVQDQVELMRKVGLLAQGAKIFATHFSHNTDLDYDGMCREAERIGITVAYDGCHITV
ncbi:MAG: hypothetical protein J1G01_00705 [Clostridiales bacterium]|nr:hypothetical protein [Clostridiales bacterium]